MKYEISYFLFIVNFLLFISLSILGAGSIVVVAVVKKKVCNAEVGTIFSISTVSCYSICMKMNVPYIS